MDAVALARLPRGLHGVGRELVLAALLFDVHFVFFELKLRGAWHIFDFGAGLLLEVFLSCGKYRSPHFFERPAFVLLSKHLAVVVVDLQVLFNYAFWLCSPVFLGRLGT